MYITLHLVDGRKITKEQDKIKFVLDPRALFEQVIIEKGYITVNWNNVVDMRPAEDDEVEHARIHGW